MPAVNPVRELGKLPVVVPSVVWESVTRGKDVVAQHIPLTVIVAPPLDVIVPPEIADVKVIEVTTVVVRTGTNIEAVVNEISFP